MLVFGFEQWQIRGVQGSSRSISLGSLSLVVVCIGHTFMMKQGP